MRQSSSAMQVAFVVYPGVTALDVVGPYEVLRFLPGADIRFVWHDVGPVTTDSGTLILGATHTFRETSRPDVVIVPGGSTSVMIRARDEQLLAWLRSIAPTASWVASVCFGSVVLAAAGLLESRDATSHWQGLPFLPMFGARPVGDRRIVVDGRYATAAGVSAGIDLGLWLTEQIAGENHAKAVQLAIEYDPQPPCDEGHFDKASTGTRLRATALLARASVNVRHSAAVVETTWQYALRRTRRGRGLRIR